MEDDHDVEPSINFIPCLVFVQKGVAKENPDKVTLTQEELARIISETKQELEDDEDDEDRMDTSSDTEQPRNSGRPSANDAKNAESTADANASGDEFNFDKYDEEESAQVASIGDVVALDPDNNLEDEEDSEAEDDLIKPTDNLLLVGHVDDDAASLEVFVYNEIENSFYVHHDFLLPSYPLCIEWMNYDPETKDTGNICAIGSMDPIVTLWDLDIQDTLEPILKLGSKGSRKKNIEKFGHTEAVLDLSWNTNFPHILASGSVDQSVILWDLDEGKPHTTIKSFQEKVQAIKFHPTESQSLLTGCCDGTVKLFDCRDPETIESDFKVWTLTGEVERITWDVHNSNYFFACTNKGKVYYIDIRQDRRVWSKKAHEEEISGLSVNAQCPGMLSTTSADGYLKVWKFDSSGMNLVYTEEAKIGRVQCLGASPNNPYTLAVGGDNRRKHLRVINTRDYETIQRAFGLSN